MIMEYPESKLPQPLEALKRVSRLLHLHLELLSYEQEFLMVKTQGLDHQACFGISLVGLDNLEQDLIRAIIKRRMRLKLLMNQ